MYPYSAFTALGICSDIVIDMPHHDLIRNVGREIHIELVYGELTRIHQGRER